MAHGQLGLIVKHRATEEVVQKLGSVSMVTRLLQIKRRGDKAKIEVLSGIWR